MVRNYLRFCLTRFRVLLGRLKGGVITIGSKSYIESGVFFSAKRNITIGKNTYIGRNSSLSCHLNIGDDVLIASNVSFVGGDHKIDNVDGLIRLSGRDTIRTITIESDVWVGHGAIIMHGVTLSKGCVVAAGSIVTKDVSENMIVGGNPANIIRKRKSA